MRNSYSIYLYRIYCICLLLVKIARVLDEIFYILLLVDSLKAGFVTPLEHPTRYYSLRNEKWVVSTSSQWEIAQYKYKYSSSRCAVLVLYYIFSSQTTHEYCMFECGSAVRRSEFSLFICRVSNIFLWNSIKCLKRQKKIEDYWVALFELASFATLSFLFAFVLLMKQWDVWHSKLFY